MAKQAAQLLAGHGVAHEVCYSSSPHDPARLARESVADGAAAVVGIGGDGLVSQVAAELVETNIPLGIIAAGRGNDFARGLGIPLDIAAACATIATAQQRRIDVGQANGRYFFSVAVMGFAAEINRKANALTRLRVNAVYPLLTVAAIFSDQPRALYPGIRGLPPPLLQLANRCRQYLEQRPGYGPGADRPAGRRILGRVCGERHGQVRSCCCPCFPACSAVGTCTTLE